MPTLQRGSSVLVTSISSLLTLTAGPFSLVAVPDACTVTCEFCQKPYEFDAIDVEHLFDQAAPRGSDSIN